MKKQGWFAEWFNTEYYHLLYRRRDDNEARKFIRLVVDFLQIPKTSTVADIACGKGRHSRVLAGMGFVVIGFDLSENNVNYARKHASGNETFYIHDIREPYSQNGFSAAFNLFTSFGYFETREEDLNSIKNIFDMLSLGGYFIQDYINGPPVVKSLPSQFTEKCGGLDFKIEKTWKAPFVVKKIVVEKPDGRSEFMEKVKLYELSELRQLHEQCGFEVIQVFGDYELGSYQPDVSPRMILVSKRQP
jgi:2-polyprenyl-3-methyl-5-hydroxy-6-metoxy-1,4-benzoquinol methylase